MHAHLRQKYLGLAFADHQNSSLVDLQATQGLEEHIRRLEEERVKIDAFKRELPLCMQLLTNGTINY